MNKKNARGQKMRKEYQGSEMKNTERAENEK